MAEVKTEDGVARLKAGEVDCSVGLRAAVGLHVDVLRVKEFRGAVAGEVFD